MIILSIDPSMTNTGYAVIEGEPGTDGQLLAAGCMASPKAKTSFARAASLACDVRRTCFEHMPDVVIVETPFEKTRGGAGHSKRSVMTLPWYGVAVGAAICGAMRYLSGTAAKVGGVANDTWAKRYPVGKDPYKTARVRLAADVYGREPGEFGCKSRAGDVADAVLMARWLLVHWNEAAAYELVRWAEDEDPGWADKITPFTPQIRQ